MSDIQSTAARIRERLAAEGVGVTPTGFVKRRFDVILDQLHADLSEKWGQDTRQNTQSVINVLLTVFADRLAEQWEVSESNYHAMYPFSAEGLSLDNAVQFGGIARESAAPTIYPIHCECLDGTMIPKNARIKSDTNPEVVLEAVSDSTVTRLEFSEALIRVIAADNETYSAVVDGTVYAYASGAGATESEIAQGLCGAMASDVFSAAVEEPGLLRLEALDVSKPCALTLSDNLTTASVTGIVNFATEQDGRIELHDGVITKIVTAVPGLISVNNKSGYIPGQARETDVELRASYADKIFLRSSRMIESVKSAILNNVPNVLAAIGYENETDFIDAYGRPPHSIEMIVDGGIDTQIAMQIDKEKAAGIQTYGGIAVTLQGDNGEPITIRFNRPQKVYVQCRVTFNMSASKPLPPDYADLARETIIAYVSRQPIGGTVSPKRIENLIYGAVAGAYYTVDVEAFPTTEMTAESGQFSGEIISLTPRQRAVTDYARIEVDLSG
jgi:uncharacterized phage protein gp47/JayE